MPLPIAPTGTRLIVLKVTAEEKIRRHLENLGLLKGAELVLISAQGGDVILKIKDGRLAINRQLAMKIFVIAEKE